MSAAFETWAIFTGSIFAVTHFVFVCVYFFRNQPE